MLPRSDVATHVLVGRFHHVRQHQYILPDRNVVFWGQFNRTEPPLDERHWRSDRYTGDVGGSTWHHFDILGGIREMRCDSANSKEQCLFGELVRCVMLFWLLKPQSITQNAFTIMWLLGNW